MYNAQSTLWPPLKPQTEPVANREAHGHTMSYLPGIPHLPSSALKCPSQGTRPSLPPHVVAQRVPEYVVAQRAPRCNRSSRGRAVLEGHRAFGFLGEAAASSEATSLGHPADSKKCSQRLQNVPATAAAQPQNLVENLNSEEPANAATPSIPDPELSSVPLSKWGLDGSTMESSQHAPIGDSATVTRMLPRLLRSHCSRGTWRSC